MRPGIPLAAVYAAAPVLLVQGRRVRRTTPRLPEATGPVGLVGGGSSGPAGEGADPLRIAVVGDSVAAGVGVGHHADTIAGRLARRMSTSSGRPVAWTVIARSGAAASEVRSRLRRHDGLVGARVVVISVGVNDVLGLRRDRRWRADLTGLLHDIASLVPEAEVVLLGVPPMQAFPALPGLLARLLGHRARRLDAIGREVCADRPQVLRLELVLEESPGLFAGDGFHPSAAVHDRLAAQVHALLTHPG